MLIALSGGADSVALLLKMLDEGRAEAAAHCNFGLRGAESDRDETFVRKLCHKLGIRLHVAHFDTRSEAARTGESIEMTARRLRYTWFDALCREFGYPEVGVAHHRDDQAETLLLNLVRGSGLHGLTGMSRRRDKVVRPLLDWSRADILQFLAERGQDYVTDSSNDDTHYRRNLIRHEVLPLLQQLNPQVAETLCDTARRLAEAESIYRLGVDSLKGQLVQADPARRTLCIDWAGLHQAPAPETLLHEWLAGYGFTPTQTAQALNLHTGGVIQHGEWLLTRSHSHLLLGPVPELISPTAVPCADGCVPIDASRHLHTALRTVEADTDATQLIQRTPHTACIDLTAIQGSLTLRSASTADRFCPFGLKGSQLVSDYLTNRHRSRLDKMAALVLCDERGILWLVGERIDQRAAVTPHTRTMLCLTLHSSSL
ncbi:MAG: tRNA lysidine(34) synthetase TilS [Alloprevotella sp.]